MSARDYSTTKELVSTLVQTVRYIVHMCVYKYKLQCMSAYFGVSHVFMYACVYVWAEWSVASPVSLCQNM